MTDALRALRDGVKAGGYPDRQTEVAAFYRGGSIAACNEHAGLARQANGGSLDAAHALHKAVLEKAIGWVLDTADDGLTAAHVYMRDNKVHSGEDAIPARSWLLAILEALIAQQGAGKGE
jgi:hypothetical protein